jgi:hypothetical protein
VAVEHNNPQFIEERESQISECLEVFMSLAPFDNIFNIAHPATLGTLVGDPPGLLRQQLIGSAAAAIAIAAVAALAMAREPYGEAVAVAQRVVALQSEDLAPSRVSPAEVPMMFRHFVP